LKSKIPLGKKPKASDDELDENEASESQSDASSDADKTGLTEITSADLSHEGTQSDVSAPAGEENKSLVHKLKKKFEEFQNKKKNSSSGEIYPGASQDESSGNSDALAKAKKKRLILIGVAAILAILFLVPDEGEDTEVSEAPVKLKPRKRPVKKNIKTESETNKEATPPVETPADSTNTASTTPPEETAPPVVEETSSDPLSASTTETTTITESPVITEPVTTEPVPTEAATTETSPVDVAPESTTPSETSDVATSSSNMVDSIDGTVTTDPVNSESITDQILEDLEKQVETKKPVEIKKEYVSPPDYEYFGRGLVYNCAGKHWACVDAPSYKTCEDNSSSVNYLNKKKECYPYNVYETAKGCQSVQNRMVSSSAKTNFCE
jgi:hypothetical protein